MSGAALFVIIRALSSDYPAVMRTQHYCSLSVGVLAWLLLNRLSVAQPEPRVEYDAPASCPSREEFLQAVQVRHSAQDEAAQAPLIRVRISSGGETFDGELRVTTSRGESAPRRVTDPDCAKVVEGLAVVAAIVLSEGDKPTEAEPAAPAVAAPEAPPQEPTPVQEPLPRREPRLIGSTFGQPDELTVPAGQLRFRRHGSYLALAGADFGTIPGFVVPRYDFIASQASFLITPADETRLLSPVVQVRWGFVGPAEHRSSDGYDTKMWGLQVGLSTCSALKYDARTFRALLCADFTAEFAQLETHSPEGFLVFDQDVGSGSGTLALDLRYSLTDWLELGLRGGPRVRYGSYYAERPDGSRLFESGVFGGQLSLGLGFTF